MMVTPTGEASEGACAVGYGTRGGSSTARGGQSLSSSMAAAKSAERRERGKARELLNTAFFFSLPQNGSPSDQHPKALRKYYAPGYLCVYKILNRGIFQL